MHSEQKLWFVVGSPRLPCGRRAKSSFEECGRSMRRKRQMSSVIQRERTRPLDGHRDWHAQRLWDLGPSNSRWRFRQTRQNVSTWRLLLLLLRKKECNNFVWNSQGAIFYDIITLGKKISSSAKGDERKRAPAQISLNWQRFYLRFVTRRYRSRCCICVTIRHCSVKVVNRWIGLTVKVDRQRLLGAPDADILAAAVANLIRDTTKQDFSRDSILLGQSESALRRTSELGSRHSGG